jgi:vacuolar protein 8
MESPEHVGPCGDQLLQAAERPSELAALRALVDRVRAGEVEAAREVRRLTRASARHRRKLAAAVEPLVAMLRSGAPDAGEPALLALLNLAVRDERCATLHPSLLSPPLLSQSRNLFRPRVAILPSILRCIRY